jgi:hypothetical protein
MIRRDAPERVLPPAVYLVAHSPGERTAKGVPHAPVPKPRPGHELSSRPARPTASLATRPAPRAVLAAAVALVAILLSLAVRDAGPPALPTSSGDTPNSLATNGGDAASALPASSGQTKAASAAQPPRPTATFP